MKLGSNQWAHLEPIQPSTLAQLRDLSKHPGSQARFAKASQMKPHQISRFVLGKQVRMDKADLKRVTAALRTFDMGAEKITKKPKRRGRAVVKIPVAEVHTLPNGLSNGHDIGLRGIIDGMAIQAEMTRRAVSEYYGQPTTH